jgi:hypothetical protein
MGMDEHTKSSICRKYVLKIPGANDPMKCAASVSYSVFIVDGSYGGLPNRWKSRPSALYAQFLDFHYSHFSRSSSISEMVSASSEGGEGEDEEATGYEGRWLVRRDVPKGRLMRWVVDVWRVGE